MAEITASAVNEFRKKTGLGLMECKALLKEADGDVQKAETLAKERGLKKAELRAGRAAKAGRIETYIHHDAKQGTMLELNCETDFVARTDDFKHLARELAIHVAATAPLAVSVDQLPAEVVERERRIYTEQVAQEGKPEAIRAKIVEGKLKKFYTESVLLEQPFVKDDSRTVGELVKEVSGKTGENVVVRRFVRYQLGEPA
jgi:elongation factor Ts